MKQGTTENVNMTKIQGHYEFIRDLQKHATHPIMKHISRADRLNSPADIRRSVCECDQTAAFSGWC